MRKQTQFNGLWQNMATGVIRFADTEHGVLWERTLEASREVWRQLDVSKSHLRGYLQAQSEAGWQMVSSNRDAAREPEAYEAWHGDMFPHGVPLRVSEYACDVVHAAMLACESDAANGWVVDTRGAVHELMPEEREMIRLTMAMDAMDDSWETDVTGPEPAMESVETVVVEPVEVEHDGVVDVELAETSETIPVVEAETAETETAELDSLSNDDLIEAIAPTFGATHGRVTTKPCTGKWRGNSDVRIMFDNGSKLSIGVAATRKAKTKTVQREFLKDAYALLSPGAVETRKRRAMRALRELESKDAEIARAHGVEPYRVLAVELGQVESVLMCPYYVVLAIGDRIVTNDSLDEFSCFVEHDEWDRLATPAASFHVSRYSNKTSIDYVFHGIGFDADSYAVYSVPDEVLANARKVLADREPRAVESEPQLPAECSAVTQEIPEVPPQVNDQARVLQVSEHVIPTGQKVAGGEMFPDVSYRSVHTFTVPVLDAAGNVVKRKKVAYAFRHNGMVHVVRRDRYEQAGRNATVEAAIAEFVAKLQKAA